jgi:protein-tyrosine phosphatase
MKILVICSGNICRSAMAACYLDHRVRRAGLSHVRVSSAGLLGIEGAPASVEAIAVLGEHGIDLTGHRSRGIGASDIRTADLVIAMTLDHLELLELRYPAREQRRFLLRAFERQAEPRGGAAELDDPIGEEISVFREQFTIIRDCVDHMLLYLKYEKR